MTLKSNTFAALAAFGALAYAATAHADCGNTWVTKATMEYLHRGTPAAGDPECNIHLYNGGQWNSYAELQHYVATYWHATVYPSSPNAPSPNPTASRISRQGFNSNVPACPTNATPEDSAHMAALPTVQIDTFSDGTRLPSCGGRQGHIEFKMVWLGTGWAKYGPSIHVMAPPPYGDLKLAPDFRLDSTQLGFARGHAPQVGRQVTYQGQQYQVVQLVGPSGGTLISQHGSTIVSSGGGNIGVVLRLLTDNGNGLRR